MSDTYPGPGHWRQFAEQSASTSTSPSTGIIETSTSGASFNQKDRQGKKESEIRYIISMSNRDYAGRGDLDQGRFRKRALFKRGLRLLRLKADASRLKTC